MLQSAMQVDQPFRKFYAKVMLFGEYSLLTGSRAVTIPWAGYSGQLRYGLELPEKQKDSARRSNSILRQFASYLAGEAPHASHDERQSANPGSEPHSMVSHLDINQFIKDLDKGLYFDSDIPTGYGLGSSGALVAAVFDHYSTLGVTSRHDMFPDEMKLLKQTLSIMENFFHATSSGIDPLSCYIGKPLQVHHDEAVVVELPDHTSKSPGGFFLLDTKLTRQTGPLVEEFRKKHQQEWFSDFMRHIYTPTVNAAVEVLLEGDPEEMSEISYILSHYQLMHFKEMIPVEFIPLWEKGLKTNDYSLKLCGAGGGGYLLGFTKDYAAARKALLPKQIKKINDQLGMIN